MPDGKRRESNGHHVIQKVVYIRYGYHMTKLIFRSDWTRSLTKGVYMKYGYQIKSYDEKFVTRSVTKLPQRLFI